MTHLNWVDQTVYCYYLSGVSTYCHMRGRHTTQALHLLRLIESGTNSVYWVECLNLLFLCVGETSNTSTAFTAVTHWKWDKQCLFNWVECLHIATCWRDTQYKHCGIYCDSLKVEQIVFVIAIEWSVCTKYNCRVLEKHATQALHLLPWPLKTQIDDIRWPS